MVLLLLLLNVIEVVILIVLCKSGKVMIVKHENLYVPAPRKKKVVKRCLDPEYDEEEE